LDPASLARPTAARLRDDALEPVLADSREEGLAVIERLSESQQRPNGG
jgi:hypothetical protein